MSLVYKKQNKSNTILTRRPKLTAASLRTKVSLTTYLFKLCCRFAYFIFILQVSLLFISLSDATQSLCWDCFLCGRMIKRGGMTKINSGSNVACFLGNRIYFKQIVEIFLTVKLIMLYSIGFHSFYTNLKSIRFEEVPL